MSSTKGYRYGTLPTDGGAYLVPSKKNESVTYASTITFAPETEETRSEIALTGAATINANISGPYPLDRCTFVLTADGSSRVVTFGTNFVSAGTVTVAANKSATISFIFSTSMNEWVETGRFVQS